MRTLCRETLPRIGDFLLLDTRQFVVENVAHFYRANAENGILGERLLPYLGLRSIGKE